MLTRFFEGGGHNTLDAIANNGQSTIHDRTLSDRCE